MVTTMQHNNNNAKHIFVFEKEIAGKNKDEK